MTLFLDLYDLCCHLSGTSVHGAYLSYLDNADVIYTAFISNFKVVAMNS